MIVLFCQYYVPKNAARRREVDLCFQKNIENPLINKIVMFFEKREDMALIPDKKHIEKKYLPERMSYGFWLRETDKLSAGTLSILVNADIYLDDSLANVSSTLDAMRAAKCFMALTRYNPEEGRLRLNENPHWTQDTWALVKDHEPMPIALYQEANFELGQPGCDNKIAYVMHSYGFRVTNPCGVIRSIHLQADDGRAYDAKASKLIGLHAFVHPTQGLLDEARLEVDLLTRNTANPIEIHVNNWINGRNSYKLNSPERLKLESADTPYQKSVPAINFDVIEVVDPQGLVPQEIPCIKTDFFVSDRLILVKEFSEKYKIYKDQNFYYCYDKYWPTVRVIAISEWSIQQLNDPLELFSLAFLPVDLASEFLTIRDDFWYDDDWRFWQHPCRTEQDAAAVHRLLPATYMEGRTVHIYLAIPWATIIDRELRPRALHAVFGLLGERIKAAKDIVSSLKGSLRVHSVCQHVFWHKVALHTKRLGITDFWISHKEKGKDTRDGFEGVRLHPWSLYAVNYREEDRNINFVYNDVKDRSVFASFTGAYMVHYISDVRKKLEALSAIDGYHIKVNDQWHFNDVVYKYQVLKDPSAKGADNLKQTVQYNELMSQSLFSLCPAGAGPNSLRFWECLANGSIPVALADTFEYPNLKALFPDLSVAWQDAVVFHPESDITSLDAKLRTITVDKQRQMQAAGLAIYKRCESMTCFGRVARLVQPQGKIISKEAQKEQANDVKNIRPPEYPTEKITLVKNQQLHLDGQTKPQLTGEDKPSPITLSLANGASVGTVWFNTAEKIYAINLYGPAELLDILAYKMQGIIKYGKYQALEFNVSVRVNQEHLQLFVDDQASKKYLSMGLRFEFKCSPAVANQLTVDFDILPNWMLYKLDYYDKTGTLYQLSELNSTRKDDLFDTENIENGRIIELIEQAKAKYKIKESAQQLFPKLPKRTENLVGEPIKDGICFYVHLMNRNENVKKNLGNWLTQSMDELILLDWSSNEPVAEIPGVFDDPRVRVVRVEEQTKFIRTLAQNLATQMSRYRNIFKCDSDVEFKGDFFAAHPLKQGEFWVGDWHHGRDFNERHLHGETYYCIDDFIKVNGYDERILAYGHDDTNLKDRMLLAGLVKKVFSYNFLHHQPHDQKNRADNQDVIHPMVRTYQNRFLVNHNLIWSVNELRTCYNLINKSNKIGFNFKIAESIKQMTVESYVDDAIDLVAGWYTSESNVKSMTKNNKIDLIWKMQVE